MSFNRYQTKRYVRREGIAQEISACLYQGIGSAPAIAEKLTERFGIKFRPTARDFEKALDMLEREGDV